MKKRGKKVNKSEEIRQYKLANPDAAPKDIVAALGERGIQVTSQAVSTALYNMKKSSEGGAVETATATATRKRGRPAGAKSPGKSAGSASSNGSSLPATALVEAKKLVDNVGGIDKAKAALEILSKLR